MRLDPRKNVNEEINNLPPIFLPPTTPRPLRPTPMRPLPKIPLRPDLGDEDPDTREPFDPFLIPLDVPFDPDDYTPSPELRRAREKQRNRKPKPYLPPDFPPEADENGDGRLSKEELANYLIVLARDVGLPDDIIEILIKYLNGTAGLLELGRLYFYRELIKELLRRIRGEIDPRFFPFDIPDPDDLPFPFN